MIVSAADTSAVSTLLPAISEDTGASLATLQWAVTGYALVGAAVIVTSGALGDIFGRRRIFIGGLLLFVASCVLIALSDSGGMGIAGRALQGAAGSTILACGLSLLSAGSSGGRADAGGVAVGRGVGGRCGRRALGGRCARRCHRVAGAVLDRRGDRPAVRAADPAYGAGVA
ncbi:major facilitator superfamily protein [Streptomyces laurentii]|uniref:Major facilitator superfamily protein n=1 Tax=Streptomyces laurentii TaxID=39478 RepID=A0A160P4P0_STRLU|nr:major facilitator superfamily protein [Streptomyces laurentii]